MTTNPRIIAAVKAAITEQDQLWTYQNLNRVTDGKITIAAILELEHLGVLKPVYFVEGYDGLLEVESKDIDWKRKKFVHPEYGVEGSTDELFTSWEPQQQHATTTPQQRRHKLPTTNKEVERVIREWRMGCFDADEAPSRAQAWELIDQYEAARGK